MKSEIVQDLISNESNKKREEQLLLKKQIFKAWTGILLSKGLVNSSKYTQMLSAIERMTK
ncbi:MAG: hypothetical protein E7602_08685 [Ruminococcaceae bacterium]|nr:hypothetical protein [Oscillospiraceae bacterium]